MMKHRSIKWIILIQVAVNTFAWQVNDLDISNHLNRLIDQDRKFIPRIGRFQPEAKDNRLIFSSESLETDNRADISEASQKILHGKLEEQRLLLPHVTWLPRSQFVPTTAPHQIKTRKIIPVTQSLDSKGQFTNIPALRIIQTLPRQLPPTYSKDYIDIPETSHVTEKPSLKLTIIQIIRDLIKGANRIIAAIGK